VASEHDVATKPSFGYRIYAVLVDVRIPSETQREFPLASQIDRI
jgi:hypothetical protein